MFNAINLNRNYEITIYRWESMRNRSKFVMPCEKNENLTLHDLLPSLVISG